MMIQYSDKNAVSNLKTIDGLANSGHLQAIQNWKESTRKASLPHFW